jgi:dihydroorotate dehydrogenase
MNRKKYEQVFNKIKPAMYIATKNKPELAHNLFIGDLNFIVKNLDASKLGFEGLEKIPKIDFAPAAGFNKNGTIPPDGLYYLGFTLNVVGSVSSIVHKGNEHPRCWRITESESIVNRLGLPGKGVDYVRDGLEKVYGNSTKPLPIEINLAPHPTIENKIEDIEKCMVSLSDFEHIDYFTLNISCPNTDPKHRDEYQKNLGDFLEPILKLKRRDQKVKLKVSPDLKEEGVIQILRAIEPYNIYGLVTTNTTTEHDPQFIPVPPTKYQAGASGPALFSRAKKVQELFEKNSGEMYKFDAVGGIRDIETLEQRMTKNTAVVKIYTAMVYRGPKVVRELRTYLNNRGE